jgi:hypothetical protein
MAEICNKTTSRSCTIKSIKASVMQGDSAVLNAMELTTFMLLKRKGISEEQIGESEH